MTTAMENLLQLLDLEQIEADLFRGRSPQDGWQRVFGGQVVAQSLAAACRTVAEERSPHSLHAYFMLMGDPTVPIVYEVDRLRDGRSFSTRRVTAIQHGKAIFAASASFQVEEPGLDFAATMPDVPAPETLPTQDDLKRVMLEEASPLLRAFWSRERPIEIRPVDMDLYLRREGREMRQHVWFRATGPVPAPSETPIAGGGISPRFASQCVLAYASDLTLLDTALFPHGKALFDPAMQVASLDHAIWFHRPCPLDGWLLYAMETPSSSGARGFSRGEIFTADGVLVASVAQEGLIRVTSK
ncbi:(3S)-malyl-CoA thioesterase [Faunimonas pinastri]|uniref:Acyl-CoA thioesterase 2 n=1 Tax=Faunimonas pinastri TaxID=1855383 RepID=A0A1H9GU76_9HYPH|nr:acyl-CoA thioesterase II [Faunimonas pinastri]SEQ53615.1 (3S)-malyl-CoA thioesterase [Faunimonas pinastri]